MLEPEPEAHAHNLIYVKDTIDLAVEWATPGQTPVVITGIGGKPGQLDSRQALLLERIEALGQYAQAQGVVVALEPHINMAIETPDQMVAFMAQVQSPAIRVNFDISHFNILGIPIAASVSKLLPYSVHTHIKDERGRHPDFEFLVPGEGEFDYVSYLQTMASPRLYGLYLRRNKHDGATTA